MNTSRKRMKVFAIPAIAALAAVQLPAGAAQAAMVGTDRIVGAEVQAGAADAARARVDALLEREDVRTQIRQWGVSPEEARKRVAALSDAEIVALSGQIAEDPAGQGVVVAVVTAGLIVFLVLLATDLLGYTDVYPFVKKTVDQR